MKKLLILFSLLCALVTASAQTTTLNGTIQDANTQVFANGTCTIQFVPLPGNAGPYTIGGASFNTQPSCTINGSGVISGTVTDNLQIKPAGSKWQFVVCPNATVPCTSTQLVVTGASMNVGTPISSVIPAISLGPLVATPRAYSDAEVTPLTAGSSYWNVTNNLVKFWSGSTWLTYANTSGNNVWLGTNIFNWINGIQSLLGFGCKTDGSDQTTCINNAIASANNLNVLWVDPGTYTHSGTIIVPSSMRILGPGYVDGNAGAAIFRYTGSAIAWLAQTPTTIYTYAIRLSGFRISSTGSASVCLDLDHMQEGEIDHMTIGGGSGQGCAIGINAHGISLSSVHHNRITWNTVEFLIDGNGVVGGTGANPSAYNEIYYNNFFEGTAGIQIKNLWATTIHDNYFEAVDNWFYGDTTGGSYFANQIQLINVRITHNGGSTGGDAGHTLPKIYHITNAGSTAFSSNGVYFDENDFSIGSIAGNTAFLIDSTTSGAVGLDLWLNKNRLEGVDNLFTSSKVGSVIHDYDGSYVQHDGLTATANLYSGISTVTERDGNAFDIKASVNGIGLYGGYGTPARFSVGGLYIGSLGGAPNLGSLIWGDGTGYKLNFGYWNGSAFVPTIAFTDTGNITTPGSIIGSTISPPQTGVNYVKMSGSFLQWFGGGTGGTQLGTMGNSSTDVPMVLANSAKFIVQGGNLQINNGVTASGGFKHQRFGATTATAATLNATASTTLTWGTAFADANYTATCTADGAISGTPVMQGITSKLAASVTVQVTNLTAVASSFGGVDCIAVHD